MGDKSRGHLVSILSVLAADRAAGHLDRRAAWGVAFNGVYVADPLAIYAKRPDLPVGAFAVVLGDGWMKRTRIAKFEYPS
jgi:NADH-quinone oxidoreductase subunit N